MHDTQLTDRFGRAHTYLRISVTDRCNLRCRYCMPGDTNRWADSGDLLSDEEVVLLAKLFASLGVTKIRLTGGEPTVRPGIEQLVERLTHISGVSVVAMTTNGTRLRDKAQSLRSAGLTALNISLDTLRRDRFRKITGRDRLVDVLAGIDHALAADFLPLRINTVVIRNVNDDELIDLVQFTKVRRVCVRFIEYMPSQSATVPSAELLSYQEMLRCIESRFELKPVWSSSELVSNVAKEFSIDGHLGTIGFITPMTNHFCDRCNRLRLTADGRLKTCLFYPAELNLRDALRGGVGSQEMVSMIQAAFRGKAESPPLADRIISANEPGMFSVGG